MKLRDRPTFVGVQDLAEGEMQEGDWWVENSRPVIWTVRVALFGILAVMVLSAWPDEVAEVVRGEISYVGLQNELIASNVVFIEIDGDTATGTFGFARPERGGEIRAAGFSLPGQPGDPVRTVNGFTATIPESNLESFIGLAERTVDEVRIIPQS